MRSIRPIAIVVIGFLVSQSAVSDIRSRDKKWSYGQHFIKGIDNVCYKLNVEVRSLDSDGNSVENSKRTLELNADLLSAVRPEMDKYGMEISPCNVENTSRSDMAILSLDVKAVETKSKPFNFQFSLRLVLSEVAKNKKTDQMSRVRLLVTDYFGHKKTQKEALGKVVSKASEHVRWSSEHFIKARDN